MDETVAGRTCEAADGTGDLDGMGQAAQPTGDSIRLIANGYELWCLRPSDLTRLLNSTPAGVVISDRQIHRHRERGNHVFVRGGRIDFLRYLAWLLAQRHDRVTRRGRGSRRSGTYSRVRWQVTAQDVLDLLEHQRYRCALTGRTLTPDTAALDHIIPVSRGGEHCIENAQVLQKAVNRAKGTLTTDEFVALCRDVVAHVGGQSDSLDQGGIA